MDFKALNEKTALETQKSLLPPVLLVSSPHKARPVLCLYVPFGRELKLGPGHVQVHLFVDGIERKPSS